LFHYIGNADDINPAEIDGFSAHPHALSLPQGLQDSMKAAEI
jgi:hypothetical protein